MKENEIRKIFQFFDSDENESISYEEFISGLRDPLNSSRLNVVQSAFRSLDTKNYDSIDISLVARQYDASEHPDVINGKMTEKQAMEFFLDTFDASGEVEGKITKKEFINYYTNIGAVIDNDEYFKSILNGVWHLNGGGRSDFEYSNMIEESQSFSQPPNLTNIKEEIKSVQTQAVLKFSQRNYSKAVELFTNVLSMLKQVYPENHPECKKIQNSIEASKRKQATVIQR
jgi:Ca2+-binding EF-hand superfamily protein